jgi:hypothetical protein
MVTTEAAVVETVRVADPVEVPVIFTRLVEPKLRVGRFVAPAGLDVIAAVSVTSPVNPADVDGVTVMVDVFPLVAPAVNVTAVLLMVKLELPVVELTVSATVVV